VLFLCPRFPHEESDHLGLKRRDGNDRLELVSESETTTDRRQQEIGEDDETYHQPVCELCDFSTWNQMFYVGHESTPTPHPLSSFPTQSSSVLVSHTNKVFLCPRFPHK
jgi:hypothetical protein